jgi:hypothetical protein
MGTREESTQAAEELGMLFARSRRLMFNAASRRLESRGESMLVWLLLNRLRREGR